MKVKLSKNHIILIIVLATLITVGLSIDYYLHRFLPQKYTIGKTLEYGVPPKGGKYVRYVYYFNGKKFTNTRPLGYNKCELNKRYFISIPLGFDDKGLILFDQAVPDSINEAPFNGWNDLPTQ